MADVVVIGAGIAGLTAAHRLVRLGADVRVFERAPHAGGHVRTVRRSGWRHEAGPNTVLGAPHVLSLAAELGLTPVQARPEAKRRYLFLDGELVPTPAGPLGAVRTPLLSLGAKLRVLSEPFRSRTPSEEDTVHDFFARQLGPDVAERLVDAFVGGVYAGDPRRLGMAAAFPRLFQLVREHGSIARGGLAMMKGRKKQARAGISSFPGGLGDLTEALAGFLGPRLQTNTEVSVERIGGAWRVGGVSADAVIVAAPAPAAAELLAPVSPELGAQLGQMEYAPVVGVHLLYRREQLGRPLDGFGLLVPRREGLQVLGVLWCSALFDVCGPDHAALTCFVGGARHPQTARLGDEEILAAVRADLQRTMGVSGAPVDVSLVRHARAIPQPGTRHLAWRERVSQLLADLPGLALTGNYLEGVSLPDAVAHAEKTARAVESALEVRNPAVRLAEGATA